MKRRLKTWVKAEKLFFVREILWFSKITVNFSMISLWLDVSLTYHLNGRKSLASRRTQLEIQSSRADDTMIVLSSSKLQKNIILTPTYRNFNQPGVSGKILTRKIVLEYFQLRVGRKVPSEPETNISHDTLIKHLMFVGYWQTLPCLLDGFSWLPLWNLGINCSETFNPNELIEGFNFRKHSWTNPGTIQSVSA